MRVKKPYPYEEFDVFCHNCKKTIVVEGPEDLTKDEQNGAEFFYLVCPECGNEIRFSGLTGYRINPEFRKLVKQKSKNFLEVGLENCRKFNQEFDGTIDKL